MFFHSLLSSLWYFSFYHLPLGEASDRKVSHNSVKMPYYIVFHLHISICIFIAFHFLTCDFTSYMQF